MKAWLYGISLALFVGAFLFVRNQEQKNPAPAPVADQDFERKKQNWADFLAQLHGLQDAFVREPSRPLIQWRQEILKLHYLWLEVRDYAFVKYEAAKREQIDAYVAGLVAKVEKQNDLAQPASADQ